MSATRHSHVLVDYRELQTVVKRLQTLIPSLQRLGKLLVILLFLLNIRSWPLVWHLRVFKDIFIYRIRHNLIRAQMLFLSPKAGLKLEDRWLNSISPVGTHPLEMVVCYRSWASIDECDFNLHLSNSSYGKVLDYSRMKTAIKMFPTFFRAGGWMPLAATHFHFIHEIPMFKSYEIQAKLAAWDHKWAYLVIKFVCKSDKKRRSATRSSTSEAIAQMSAIGTGESPGTSVVGSPNSKTPLLNNVQARTGAALDAVAVQLAGQEPDGTVLHTLHVSQICFKIGRITVPPSLVLGASGFTGFPGYSLTAPHAEWQEARKVVSKPLGGSPRKMRELMTGGWKNVPESERWWDRALGPAVEEQRMKNLALIEELRKGLEGTRML